MCITKQNNQNRKTGSEWYHTNTSIRSLSILNVEVLLTLPWEDDVRDNRGRTVVGVFISQSSAFITSHTAALWSQTAIHSVCVFLLCHLWPGVGEAPQLYSRLSVWQTAHCGIWRDSSLVTQTCTPGLARYCTSNANISLYWKSYLSPFTSIFGFIGS